MSYSATFLENQPTRAELEAQPGGVVVEFGAPWCGYCKAVQPLLEAAFAASPQVLHLKVEDGPGRPLGRGFRVKLWPTLVFMRDGVEVMRMVRPGDAAAIADALAAIAAGAAGAPLEDQR